MTRFSRRPAALLGAVTALLIGSVAASTPATAKEYVSKNGYRITPPAGWKTMPGSTTTPDVIFLAPPVKGFSANINVVVTPAAPGETITQVPTQIRPLFSRMFTAFSPMSQGYTTTDGAKAYTHTARYTMGNGPQKLRMRMRQVIALRKGKAYTFTCTAGDAQYANNAKAFDAALKSIRWK